MLALPGEQEKTGSDHNNYCFVKILKRVFFPQEHCTVYAWTHIYDLSESSQWYIRGWKIQIWQYEKVGKRNSRSLRWWTDENGKKQKKNEFSDCLLKEAMFSSTI